MKLFAAFIAAACAGSVAAHGVLLSFTANGKSYEGPGPVEESMPALPESPIRQVFSNGPTKDVNSTDMACGVGSTGVTTKGVAQVSAGSEVQFQFGPWVHPEGPVTTYMGKCPGTADTCDGTQIDWFKIDERGYDEQSKTWYQGNVLHEGKPGTATVPAGIENGIYLIRYEIVALHIAATIGGAEFYISCTQVEVINGGTTRPAEGYIVRFPGAYHADDKGILVDIYTDFQKYDYPGPPVYEADSNSTPPQETEQPEDPEPTCGEATVTETETMPEPTATETNSETEIPVTETETETEPAPTATETNTEVSTEVPTGTTDPAEPTSTDSASETDPIETIEPTSIDSPATETSSEDPLPTEPPSQGPPGPVRPPPPDTETPPILNPNPTPIDPETPEPTTTPEDPSTIPPQVPEDPSTMTADIPEEPTSTPTDGTSEEPIATSTDGRPEPTPTTTDPEPTATSTDPEDEPCPTPPPPPPTCKRRRSHHKRRLNRRQH
jgi:hypothetical protein